VIRLLTYTDEVHTNEKRFEQINHFPDILSKSKHVASINFEKGTSRDDDQPNTNPCPYDSNKDTIFESKGKSVPKLQRMVGRTVRNSIYPQYVAPITSTTDSISRALKLTYKDSHPKGNVSFARMTLRDDKMYKLTEGYKPKRLEIDSAIILALEKLRKKQKSILEC
jgi:hypothetical protein